MQRRERARPPPSLRGEACTLLRYDGEAWRAVPTGLVCRRMLRTLCVEPGSDVMAAGDGGVILGGER